MSAGVYLRFFRLPCLNEGIDNKREELLWEYTDYRDSDYRLQFLDDYEELRKHVDAARYYGCQFVIATHSPFLLALPNAAIYDLDAEVPCQRKWTELESVCSYRDFFLEHEKEFQ